MTKAAHWMLSTGIGLAAALMAQAAQAAPTPAVTVTDNGDSWTLDNGIVKATISKDTGLMPSLVYHGKDVLGGNGGSWEHTPKGAPHLSNSLTIDPAANDGERVEVSIKGVTDGVFTLSPNAPGGGAQADMEIRYALGRGDSGIYVYAIYDHPASYPAGGTGAEDRYITRLSQDFDWITVDKDRNMLEAAPKDWGAGVVVHAKEQRIMSTGVYKNSVEHKYTYSGMQYQTKAYGWSSTTDHVGVWFINPTVEYLSGGPFRIDLDAHFDGDNNPPPIILDYWHSGHYAGANTRIAAGEAWHKVIGPIFVYVNSLDHPQPTTPAELKTLADTAGNPAVPASWTDNANALWQDAIAQAQKENTAWPFGWVKDAGYTPADQRGTVTGRLVLDDPLAPAGSTKTLPHLIVGLTDPAGKTPPPANVDNGRFAGMYTGPDSWIHDAKGYQFFNDGKADGTFTLTKVRPGTYTLHAYADGVLGDYMRADVTVEPGKTLDLGTLDWKPVRHGHQVWEIGYPDRSAHEFFKGDGKDVWLWGWNLRYALLFPRDITYTVGQSDWRKDWFFEEVPHATDLSFVNSDAKDPANQRYGWVKAEQLSQYPQTDTKGPWRVYGQGRTTTWTVKFTMPSKPHGTAALRVAFAGVDGLGGVLPVAVNGQGVGGLGDGSNPENARLVQTNAIRYNTDQGFWQQRTLTFDAAALKAGENTMTFTVAGGDLQSGVVWDYLRLELDDGTGK